MGAGTIIHALNTIEMLVLCKQRQGCTHIGKTNALCNALILQAGDKVNRDSHLKTACKSNCSVVFLCTVYTEICISTDSNKKKQALT